MEWAEITIVFLISHLAGDFLLQTDWQAEHKHGGLGRDSTARTALFSHVAVYTLCFVPALIWVGGDTGALAAVGLGAVIFLPHLVIDDGRIVGLYLTRVKHAEPDPRIAAPVDQAFHALSLCIVALLIGTA